MTSREVRRLHHVGSCGKVPGEHYRIFEVWGPLIPPESEIDVVCKNCFRGGVLPMQDMPADELLVESSSSSSSSASSSSSSGSEKQGAGPSKRRKHS